MKYEELAQEQREFFDTLIENHGEPPEKFTHFDMDDNSNSSWMYKLNGDWRYFTGCVDDSSDVPFPSKREPIEIPEKPWYLPEEVAFKPSTKPSGSSNPYYWIEIPLERVEINEENGTAGFMLEEYLKYGLDNDFDRCNLAKTNHRIGKKPGNDDQYEIDKLKYYSEQIKKNWGK